MATVQIRKLSFILSYVVILNVVGNIQNDIMTINYEVNYTTIHTFSQTNHSGYSQFGGHKNRENKSLKIEINVLRVCFGLFWAFIHVRLTIQRIRIFAL